MPINTPHSASEDAPTPRGQARRHPTVLSAQRRTRMTAGLVNTVLHRRVGRAAVQAANKVVNVLPGGSRIIPAANGFGSDRRGGVGTAVLLENDRVRVWELRLAPGQRTALHQHRLDYVIVPITEDRVGAEIHPDSTDQLGARRQTLRDHGATRTGPLRPARRSRDRVKPGNTRYHDVLIELKDSRIQ